MRWWTVIGLCCGLVWSGCGTSKFYERHVEPAYDAQGQRRAGYATINLEFLDAIDKDLEACYGEKRP